MSQSHSRAIDFCLSPQHINIKLSIKRPQNIHIGPPHQQKTTTKRQAPKMSISSHQVDLSVYPQARDVICVGDTFALSREGNRYLFHTVRGLSTWFEKRKSSPQDLQVLYELVFDSLQNHIGTRFVVVYYNATPCKLMTKPESVDVIASAFLMMSRQEDVSTRDQANTDQAIASDHQNDNLNRVAAPPLRDEFVDDDDWSLTSDFGITESQITAV